MTAPLSLIIDLTHAGLDLDPEDLEIYTLRLVNELKDGLAEDAALARVATVPDGSKAAEGTEPGLLKALVDPKKLVALLGWLKTRLLDPMLEIQYGDVTLRYQTPEQLEQQIQALEKISTLTIRVVKRESGEG
jgi:hypothetical protein